jgi:hypothetical protein
VTVYFDSIAGRFAETEPLEVTRTEERPPCSGCGTVLDRGEVAVMTLAAIDFW